MERKRERERESKPKKKCRSKRRAWKRVFPRRFTWRMSNPTQRDWRAAAPHRHTPTHLRTHTQVEVCEAQNWWKKTVERFARRWQSPLNVFTLARVAMKCQPDTMKKSNKSLSCCCCRFSNSRGCKMAWENFTLCCAATATALPVVVGL